MVCIFNIAGRADGIQPRTIEVLKNMSPLGEQMLARASASYERVSLPPLLVTKLFNAFVDFLGP